MFNLQSVFALLTLATAPATTGLAPGESLLLAGFSYGNIEPVAIRTATGSYRELPSAQALDALAAKEFKPGQGFDNYLNGTKMAHFSTKAFSTQGCFDYGILEGSFQPPQPQKASHSMISFSAGFPGQRLYPGKSPMTPAYSGLAREYARKYFIAKGVPATSMAKMHLDQLSPIRLNLGKVAGLAFSASLPVANPEVGCHGMSLSVVAEVKAGALLPHLELYKTGDPELEGCSETYDLISSFQAEVGSEYLLMEGFGYESNWYEIYKRKADGNYSQVFTGGGGGC